MFHGPNRVHANALDVQYRGLISTGEYLLRNLGLSLTDHYWIKPIDSSLKWAEVNLFDNDFRDNIISLQPSADPG